MKNYKYALGITSQLPFCSVPLRLDAYNKCQFSCAFCFAKARGGNSKPKGLQSAKPETLLARLNRVAAGKVRSATDEFLERRIPIQLGGMTDPFSPWERESGVTLELLKVLASFNYPTILSTKGTLAQSTDYLKVLANGNFYVRQSFTALEPKSLAQIERGVPTQRDRLQTMEALSHAGVPVSARLQPVFANSEKFAENTIAEAADAGAKHVSVEYLKWPVESNSTEQIRLSEILPEAKAEYLHNGAKRVGREFVLPPEFKYPRLVSLKTHATRKGLVFGFADNEFLHMNEFDACCNAADLFLEGANFFDANILGLIRSQRDSDEIRFDTSLINWIPKHSVFSHLNSKSRPEKSNNEKDRYIDFLKEKWNASSWRSGPRSFWGISELGKKDTAGQDLFVCKTEEL